MKLIGASAVITCDDNFSVIKDGGILFDENKIIKIGKFNELKKMQYIDVRFYESCVITPSLINTHIHFEFSQNTSSLNYGNFGEWLDSVILKRESLMKDSSDAIKTALKETLSCGVGSVGAISSNGLDLEILNQSPLKVLFFNEIIGTNKEYNEKIMNDFNERLEKSLLLTSPNFKSGIALHSPYSLNFELASYAIKKAMEHKLLVSTHFLESKEELMWLEYKKGYFKKFFKRFFNDENALPYYSKESFLRLFKNCESLFVHCLFLNNDDWATISKLNVDIVSCPRSNRLLNNRYFDFLKAKDYRLPLIIATDGKSSNNNLNILDEARVALFAYEQFNINNLAKEILLSITRRPAKRLRFNNGFLEKGRASDFAIFYIKDIENCSQVILNFLLHAKKVEDLYINGKRIDIENY
ncbi:hypothetical protein CCY99_07780 [Helicobacter sp. 16-1353]|uniref:aminofutalosine deaminase family hydrolase n=1 Tax=Helicobacter sp. 16-1353 TaxID=2004996 RepID=UPI000DCEC5A7|nr:aminofutalosine deaminase family hydrolase [Helicobacter sp. 16-1353]RAX52041.1 hypothetical protein CCY99_07780 [Helicobacter sp. 16-1353]